MTRWLPILVLWMWSGPHYDPHSLTYRFEEPRIEFHWRAVQVSEQDCKAWGKREAKEAMAVRYRVECKQVSE